MMEFIVKRAKNMQNRINENGLEYALVGDYYLPNLALPEEHHPSENGADCTVSISKRRT